MYLYGRKEGKIGLFGKDALDTSDYPKCVRWQRKRYRFSGGRRRFEQTLKWRQQPDVSSGDQAK